MAPATGTPVQYFRHIFQNILKLFLFLYQCLIRQMYISRESKMIVIWPLLQAVDMFQKLMSTNSKTRRELSIEPEHNRFWVTKKNVFFDCWPPMD